MTKFEKDLKGCTGRKRNRGADQKKGRACKNGFRSQCIAQEYTMLKAEYDKIEELF